MEEKSYNFQLNLGLTPLGLMSDQVIYQLATYSSKEAALMVPHKEKTEKANFALHKELFFNNQL